MASSTSHNTLPSTNNTSPTLAACHWSPFSPVAISSLALASRALDVAGSAISSRTASQELLDVPSLPHRHESEAEDSGVGSVLASPRLQATSLAVPSNTEPIPPPAESSALYVYAEGIMPEAHAKQLQASARDRYMQVQRGRRASRAKRRRRELGGCSSSEDEADGAVSTQCPHCNKTYRQNNSLFKHLYEHHPHWQNVSEQYNFTKHSKVQIMQTAELLLSLKAPTQHGLQPLVRF
eukprot:m.19971 g.19971  ORF g.19971 m.19971 type:complete len:237 (+) comp10982_c0_seq1:445-1155(+)